MSKKGGLGRGLGALINNDNNLQNLVEEKKAGEVVTDIAVDLIDPNPYQPRKDFPEEELRGLADSIKAQGLLQPVVVRKKNGRYEMVAGERRLRATKLVGTKTISALVRAYTDTESMNLALLENLQRQDLNPIEVANAYSRLMNEGGMTQDELSEKMGVSRSAISNSVRLLSMPEEVQDYVRQNLLGASSARVIAGMPDVKAMKAMAKDAVEHGWTSKLLAKNVAEFKKIYQEKKLIEKGKLRVATPEQQQKYRDSQRQQKAEELREAREKKQKELDADMKNFVRNLEYFSGERVEIVSIPGTKAKVLGFKFANDEDLRRIYHVFSKLIRESKKEQQENKNAAPKKFSV